MTHKLFDFQVYFYNTWRRHFDISIAYITNEIIQYDMILIYLSFCVYH